VGEAEEGGEEGKVEPMNEPSRRCEEDGGCQSPAFKSMHVLIAKDKPETIEKYFCDTHYDSNMRKYQPSRKIDPVP
jgi:hypothetical protein